MPCFMILFSTDCNWCIWSVIQSEHTLFHIHGVSPRAQHVPRGGGGGPASN